MNKFFKPLSKRDARIAAVLFGAGFLYMLFSIVKDLMAGSTFEELHADIMILAFIGIIEWGMVTISFSKDKPKEEASEENGSITEDKEDKIALEDPENE